MNAKNKRWRAYLSIAPILCCVMLTFTAAAVAQVRSPLTFVYTYSLFALNDTSALLELAYGIPENGLTYVKIGGDNRNQARLNIHVRIYDVPAQTIAIDYDWTIANPQPTTTQEAMGKTLMGIKNFSLKPGPYRANIAIRDLNDPVRLDTTNFTFSVPKFSTGRLMMSDVEIASELELSDEESDPFYKNSYRVVPLLTDEIEPPDLSLKTYIEVYNAHKIPADEYSLTYVLTDSSGRAFYQKDLVHRRPTAESILEANIFPLNVLPSGQYFLVAKIFNAPRKAATDSMKVVRAFRLSNPNVDDSLRALRRAIDSLAAARALVVDPMYSGLSEKELDERFMEIRFIASKHEKLLWSGLEGIPPKGMFLTQFWAHRDPTPMTEVNEDRENYYERLSLARKQYRSMQSPRGWDSDRGRILLQYGKPDGVERHPQDINRRPYEIWSYNSVGYEFVFIDRTQTGHYVLVTSTVVDEVQNSQWETIAKLNPQAP